jgi:hypothetical protein
MIETLNNNNISKSKENDQHVGVHLYEKALKQRNQMIFKANEMINERNKKEMEHTTFYPKINSNYVLKNKEKPEDRLNSKQEMHNLKIEQAKAAKMFADQKQCSFHPQIAKK